MMPSFLLWWHSLKTAIIISPLWRLHFDSRFSVPLPLVLYSQILSHCPHGSTGNDKRSGKTFEGLKVERWKYPFTYPFIQKYHIIFNKGYCIVQSTLWETVFDPDKLSKPFEQHDIRLLSSLSPSTEWCVDSTLNHRSIKTDQWNAFEGQCNALAGIISQYQSKITTRPKTDLLHFKILKILFNALTANGTTPV